MFFIALNSIKGLLFFSLPRRVFKDCPLSFLEHEELFLLRKLIWLRKSLKVFCQKDFFLVFWFCVKSLFKCYLVKIFTSGVGFLNMQLSLYIVQMQFHSGILSLHITFQCVLLEMTFYRQTPEPLPSQSNKWCGLWKWASCWEFLLRSVCSLHLRTIVAVLNHAKALWWFGKEI